VPVGDPLEEIVGSQDARDVEHGIAPIAHHHRAGGPDRFPDLDVLTAAMERDWQALAGSVVPNQPSRVIVESPVGSAA
jgi:hypothetical protein